MRSKRRLDEREIEVAFQEESEEEDCRGDLNEGRLGTRKRKKSVQRERISQQPQRGPR